MVDMDDGLEKKKEEEKTPETGSSSFPAESAAPPPPGTENASTGNDAGCGAEGKSVFSLSPESERTIAMICHLAGLAGLFLPYIGNILGPMLIWAWKKDRSAFVDMQGKSAINYQISLSMVTFCLFVLGVILSVICIGFLFSLLSLLLMYAGMIFSILAALSAREGKSYRYPLSYPFIR